MATLVWSTPSNTAHRMDTSTLPSPVLEPLAALPACHMHLSVAPLQRTTVPRYLSVSRAQIDMSCGVCE
eukprot:m.17314 g.17314  ORF g.17314 m.17314 type:complete len:69 (+) comp3484_c0_seq1:426-632(+)